MKDRKKIKAMREAIRKWGTEELDLISETGNKDPTPREALNKYIRMNELSKKRKGERGKE